MHIKRYEAANMREAMAKIKKELGPDAVILSTKKISGVGPLIEVMAAREREPAQLITDHPLAPQNAFRETGVIGGLRQEIHDLKSYMNGLSRQLTLKSDISDLKESLNILCDTFSFQNDAPLRHLYMILIANGFTRVRALRLTEAIKKEFPRSASDSLEKAASLAEQMIARSFPRDDIKGKRIKAFVGPTGVGKTTTLAKLAAHYCLEKKMKVGLITTDTYRIAAPEQLKVYAKIMGLPLEVAQDKNTFLHALTNFSDKDVILVDTPGRSPQDHLSLSALKSVLTDDTEAFLLLSPLTRGECLIEAADRFRILDYNRIILTKIDECSLLGSVMDVLDRTGKPVSYVTTGQNVPKDIEKANPVRLAQLTLQNRFH